MKIRHRACRCLAVIVTIGLMACIDGCASVNCSSVIRSKWYSVKSFGAKGDGNTIDTAAANAAIAAAARNGGGTVDFPAGAYLCYSIHLKSNVTLHIGEGATI